MSRAVILNPSITGGWASADDLMLHDTIKEFYIPIQSNVPHQIFKVGIHLGTGKRISCYQNLAEI